MEILISNSRYIKFIMDLNLCSEHISDRELELYNRLTEFGLTVTPTGTSGVLFKFNTDEDATLLFLEYPQLLNSG